MFEESGPTARLRERLTNGTEDRIGRALADLLDNPLVTGAIGKAFDARERAAQAQELALGALNIPTAADVERLTRRLRSVSQRLEGIEDGVQRIGRALADTSLERRLSAVEDQLKRLNGRLIEKSRSTQSAAQPASAQPTRSGRSPTPAGRSSKPAESAGRSSKRGSSSKPAESMGRSSEPAKRAPS